MTRKRKSPTCRRPSPTYEGEVAALAVAEDEPWWTCVNGILEALEWEVIEEARQAVGNTTLCVNALGASEGIALARRRLSELREQALRGMRERQQ